MERNGGATMMFGTPVPLDEVIRVLSSRGTGMAARKRELEMTSGVFYYNHDRLIMPLVRLARQGEVNKGSQLMTTSKKVTMYGIVVVGTIREGFLIPEHNKAGYQATAFEPNVFARPQRPSFLMLHRQVNEKFKEHLKCVITPAYFAAVQRVTPGAPVPKFLVQEASRSRAATTTQGSSSRASPSCKQGGKRKKRASSEVEPLPAKGVG